jgi:hypothetical protein
MIYDRAMMVLVHCFLLGGVSFGMDHCSGTFSFVLTILVFFGCVHS